MSRPPNWIHWETAARLLKKRSDMKLPDPPINPQTATEIAMWQSCAEAYELEGRAAHLGVAAIMACVAFGNYIEDRDHYGSGSDRARKKLGLVEDAYRRTGMDQ